MSLKDRRATDLDSLVPFAEGIPCRVSFIEDDIKYFIWRYGLFKIHTQGG